MKPQRRFAVKGRAEAIPAPDIEELTGENITRREAYTAGHRAALFDEFCECEGNIGHRLPEHMPILPNGHRDASIQPDDPVTIPYWAFVVVKEMVSTEMIYGFKKRGKPAKWWKQHYSDLKHWHRYALVKQAIKQGRAKWTADDQVYDLVAKDIAGTAFAAKAKGVKKSYAIVAKALKTGHAGRFYRSTSDGGYFSLLNQPGPIVIKVRKNIIDPLLK